MRRAEPYLTVRAVRPIVSGLRKLGHDPTPLIAGAGIDAALLDDPDAHVPMSAGIALLVHAVDTTGDPDLGLHLAEHADLGTLDVHFYVMLSSPNLAAAYERLSRYQRLIHESTTVALEIEDTHAILRHQLPGGLPVPRQSAEFIVAAWVRGGRAVTGSDWEPLEVRFAHRQPTDTREHARFFRAPIRFGTAENALVLPVDLLKRPWIGADASLLALLDRYAADRLATAPRSMSLADRARAALSDEIRGGTPSTSRLASRLNMSVRSLNRALAAERTSYRQLLDQLRQEVSIRLLRDPRVAISEVAFLTGFSELSAFYRAFKRWTGKTPADLRGRHSR